MEYVVEEGPAQITPQTDGSLQFTLTPTGGPRGLSARIRSVQKFSSGRFCADIKPFQNDAPGPVFAMYVADKNPLDRATESWHEIDFEFLANSRAKGVWTNHFYGRAPAVDRGQFKPEQPPMTTFDDFATYCIEFSNQRARLYINQELHETYLVPGPWNEMYAFVSIWGEDIPTWSGLVSTLTQPESAWIKNMRFEPL